MEQMPAAYEHESNGIIENGNKVGKGLMRVLLLALEARVNGRIPCTHPVFAWLAEHAADVMTKYLAGKDGKSAYERLFGKTVREEALEFGEGLWRRPPHTESHNVLMEPRWRAGAWLGCKWGRRRTSSTTSRTSGSTMCGPCSAALQQSGGP